MLWIACGSATQAASPSEYLILRPNMVKTGKHGRRVFHPGLETPAVAQGYAYGWFGAAPRGHWSRHTGYYNNYIRWTLR
jgi:hypothetical protein